MSTLVAVITASFRAAQQKIYMQTWEIIVYADLGNSHASDRSRNCNGCGIKEGFKESYLI